MVQVAIVTGDSRNQKPDELPRLSWYVYLLSFMAVIGGFLFGYDTGIVSSAMLYVPDNSRMHPMSSVWKELIVAICPGMAAVGALLAGPSTDLFGRKKLIIASSVVFTAGAAVCAAAPEKNTLLVGRILLGIAIGFASMTVPVYVGEAAPAHVRGVLITWFQLMITFGLMASNIIAGGFSYVSPYDVGWRLMFAFAGVPALIQLVGFFFLPESPRWLLEHGRLDESEKVLQKVYNGNKEWVEFEIREITDAFEEEKMSKEEGGGKPAIVRIFTTPHVLKALVIGSLLQALQQLGGVNTIMYYTGTIIRSAGITDKHTTIWISVGISGVNFASTFVPMWLIERVGRRILLLVSVAGVVVALILMGIAFLLINRNSADVLSISDWQLPPFSNASAEHFSKCVGYTNCDFCVTDENCGFCSVKALNKRGYCVPLREDDSDHASTGPCSDDSNTATLSWADNYCKTKYTAMPIVLMVVYLAFFAIGFAPLPWVMNAEFYPLWARSTCCAITTFFNWAFNLLISQTFLTLSQSATKYGAFFIYAGITCCSFVFFFFFIPETKGYNIEEVEMLFMNKKQRAEALANLEKAKQAELSSSLSSSKKDVSNEEFHEKF